MEFNTKYILDTISSFFNFIHFNPSNGDWSAALITLIIGLGGLFSFIYKSNKAAEEGKRAIKVEEDENFMRYRERFADLWLELSKDGKAHLYKNFRKQEDILKVLSSDDKNAVGRIKTITYQIILLLSDIEFIYCHKQDTSYWKRWNSTFKYVFSKPLFQTAFIKHYDDLKESNYSFVEYVENTIKEVNQKSKTLEVSNENALDIVKSISK